MESRVGEHASVAGNCLSSSPAVCNLPNTDHIEARKISSCPHIREQEDQDADQALGNSSDDIGAVRIGEFTDCGGPVAEGTTVKKRNKVCMTFQRVPMKEDTNVFVSHWHPEPVCAFQSVQALSSADFQHETTASDIASSKASPTGG